MSAHIVRVDLLPDAGNLEALEKGLMRNSKNSYRAVPLTLALDKISASGTAVYDVRICFVVGGSVCRVHAWEDFARHGGNQPLKRKYH